MTDKNKKFEEMSVFIKEFDNRVSTQWEQWKNELYSKLETTCKTQEELDELVEHLKKQNIGGITDDALRIAHREIKIIQNFHILSTLQTCLVLCFLAPFNFI